MDAPIDDRIVSSPPSAPRWWDKHFTDLLLDAIPGDAQQIVDYGCGNAHAAYALLPSLPRGHYVGVALEDDALRDAERHLMTTAYASRISLRRGKPLDLPVPDAMADVFLSILRLQHCPDVRSLLTGEVQRILRPGGILVALEPDNLGQRFYYDGVLEELTQTFHTFCLRARVLRQPADISIGPRLPQVLKRAGFADIHIDMHLIGSTRYEPAKSFCDRILRVAKQTATLAGIYEEAEEYKAVIEAIRRFQFSGIPKRLGHSAHLVPAFRVRASR